MQSEIESQRRRVLKSSLALALPSTLFSARAANQWPDKPIRLVVGYPAGTSPDSLARTLSEPLSKALGQPVVIENKSGAGGNIGTDIVAKSKDGYTIGIAGNGPLTTAKLLYPALPYDVVRDLTPVSLVASSPFALVVASSVPAKNLTEFIAYAKQQGNRLSYGSIGLGSGAHLCMELLKSLTGIKPIHIPFQGSPQVVTSMIGGQLDMGFMVPSIALPHVQSGKLRILGVSTASRNAALPEVPSISQVLNLPQFDVDAWNAIIAPANMPKAIAQKLSSEISQIVRTPEIRRRLFDQGWQALGIAPEGLSRKIKDETALWAGVIKFTNTRTE